MRPGRAGPQPERLPGMPLGSQGRGSCPALRPLRKPPVPPDKGERKEPKTKVSGCSPPLANPTRLWSDPLPLSATTNLLLPSLNTTPISHSQMTSSSILRKPKPSDENPKSKSHSPSLALHKEVPFSPNKAKPSVGPTHRLLGDSPSSPSSPAVNLLLCGTFHPASNNQLQQTLPWAPDFLSTTSPSSLFLFTAKPLRKMSIQASSIFPPPFTSQPTPLSFLGPHSPESHSCQGILSHLILTSWKYLPYLITPSFWRHPHSLASKPLGLLPSSQS